MNTHTNAQRILSGLLTLAACLPAMAGEVRNVNGRDVDLGPVMQWFQSRKGERPLPHWKRLQFDPQSVHGRAAGGVKCSVEIDGERKSIILGNPPVFILGMIEANEAALRRMAELERFVDSAMARLDEPDVVIVTQSSVRGQSGQTPDHATLRRQIRAADAEHARLRASLKLTGDSRLWFDFAMFTGHKVGPREVWDCGRRGRSIPETVEKR